MNPGRYNNRELSWLEFNRRVLQEAWDSRVPLLERIKFLAIFSSNLDEFFMVRVARLKRKIEAGDQGADADGLSPAQTMQAIAEKVHQLTDEQHRCFLEEIDPRLRAEGIRLMKPDELNPQQSEYLTGYFNRSLFPIITPLAIDPGHPFPHVANRSLCLVASLKPSRESPLPSTSLSVVHIPSNVAPRFIRLPAPPDEHPFILLEDVIAMHLPRLYYRYEIRSCNVIRVTRDSDIALPHGRVEDLLTAIEQGLRERRMGTAVRLQYDPQLPAELLNLLVEELELSPMDLYAGKGFPAFTDLLQFYSALDIPRLKDKPVPPAPVAAFDGNPSPWQAISNGDTLVYHPYHSFDTVTRFVEQAAEDPKVLAIKMTLYRVSPTSPIAKALTRAAEAGKEVAVMVELQARFDEGANIGWARALEEVGAHVVYGWVGYKTHCKACLVVRREADGIRRYCHLATGNYNVRTSGIYSDLGLFTCHESFGEDMSELFNLLTGYTRSDRFHHLVVAPMDLKNDLLLKIRREAEHARLGRPAEIIAKMNGLADTMVIDELYAASQAGVKIALVVRGVCCLKPGAAGLSENIKVVSVIDRYLEHARIYYFQNGDTPEYFLSSADWMPRNLERRLEVAFPVIDPVLQKRLMRILEIHLADTEKSWILMSEGCWRRPQPKEGEGIRSQETLYRFMQELLPKPGGMLPAQSL